MTKTAYTYTVLRYVHDTTTGEFINAGVVLAAPDQRFLGVRVRHTYGRLSAMFPDLDRDAFRSSMRVIERALKELARAYAKDDLFPALIDLPLMFFHQTADWWNGLSKVLRPVFRCRGPTPSK